LFVPNLSSPKTASADFALRREISIDNRCILLGGASRRRQLPRDAQHYLQEFVWTTALATWTYNLAQRRERSIVMPHQEQYVCVPTALHGASLRIEVATFLAFPGTMAISTAGYAHSPFRSTTGSSKRKLRNCPLLLRFTVPCGRGVRRPKTSSNLTTLRDLANARKSGLSTESSMRTAPRHKLPQRAELFGRYAPTFCFTAVRPQRMLETPGNSEIPWRPFPNKPGQQSPASAIIRSANRRSSTLLPYDT